MELSLLKESRLLKGYTQEYVSNFLGCTQECYHRLENGVQSTTFTRAYILSIVLDIDIKDVVLYFVKIEHENKKKTFQ